MAKIYLVSARKQWEHDVPDGWKEIYWDRGDYIECGIFEKPDEDLTDEDKELVQEYGEEPDEWI